MYASLGPIRNSCMPCESIPRTLDAWLRVVLARGAREASAEEETVKILASELASEKVRLFLICWMLFSLHFATNVVREHYPAFALVERGDFKLDEYVGFHSDIFVHTDGHAYIGNQVATSVFAALPLWIFDPALDALEDRRKEQLASGAASAVAAYDTEYPMRAAFMQQVKAAGLDLRFGAATAITTVFLTAPLSALMVTLLFHLLLVRGVPRGRAYWLALIFGLGTPLFYRTGNLSNNVFLMYATFVAFWLIWDPRGTGVSWTRRFVAGFLAGAGLAFDYSGVIPLLVLYGYLGLRRMGQTSFVTSFRESLVFVLGSIPSVGFLLFSQWVMYGDPFMPGQYWMPAVNFTDQGWRGFSFPELDLFLENLTSPNWGLFPFGPLLLLAFLPALYKRESLVVPRQERLFIWSLVLALFLFCAANQYSRMQWNSGFRYFLVLVPFLYLLLCDHLARVPGPLLFLLGFPAILHTWVLCQVRYTVPLKQMLPEGNAVLGCWTRFLEDGVQYPWLTVLRQTTPDASSWIHYQILPYALLAACLLVWFALEYFARFRSGDSVTQSPRR